MTEARAAAQHPLEAVATLAKVVERDGGLQAQPQSRYRHRPNQVAANDTFNCRRFDKTRQVCSPIVSPVLFAQRSLRSGAGLEEYGTLDASLCGS